MSTSINLILGIGLLSTAIEAKLTSVALPDEIRSDHFAVTVNGQPVPVAHAAAGYYFVNFDMDGGAAAISITASSADYWAKGVEVEPWRHGIRPALQGKTINFSVAQPVKLSVSRPDDHSAGSEMLFLFANVPEVDVPKNIAPGIRYYGPGVYHEDIAAKNNETIYLADGAVVFGSLNIWGVENVKIFGRGIVIYDGPQDPNSDTGWMHRPNWHVIGMDKARNVQISGITCVVRSRTWMIQMLDSTAILFENVKVIGGNPANANQDGMDWLGGGDSVVRDCFIRASDDIFALYGNWLGYTPNDLTTPGHDVKNILIENSVLSTSISNVVRVSWPQKIFNSAGFVMRNSDVIQMGSGGCRIPFALLEIWDDPAGSGQHAGYLFENIRLEHWYSLLQLRQTNPQIRDVTFRNILALENSSLVPSVLSGDVSGVHFKNVKLANTPVHKSADIPLSVESGAKDPAYEPNQDSPQASFSFKPGAITPGKQIRFTASSSTNGSKAASYEWIWGDGTKSSGGRVHHAFQDTAGTLLDHSGRFRVLLKVTDPTGKSDWSSQSVVVSESLAPSQKVAHPRQGIRYHYYEGSWNALPDFSKLPAFAQGTATSFDATPRRRSDNYALVFDGYVKVPRDGGYTFTMLSRDGGRLEIGSAVVAQSPAPVAQVCGSIGNMVQQTKGSLGLKRGLHPIHIALSKTLGDDAFHLLWEGPGITLSDVPVGVFFRP